MKWYLVVDDIGAALLLTVNIPLIEPGGPGVSADYVHGFERFNLQNVSRPGGIGPCGLADDLGRLEENGRGNREPERLSGLEIDDQLELCRLLHRQVGGLGTLEDLVHIRGRASPLVQQARPIAEKAASLHKRPTLYLVHGRQAARGREFCEPSAVLNEYGVPQDEERTRVCPGHRREGAVKRVGTARLLEVQLDAQRLGRHLRRPHIEGDDWIGGIPEDGHAGDGGKHFPEDLQVFPDEFGAHDGQSGDVATGPGEAGDEAAPHRIANAHHDDRDRRGRVLGGQRRWRIRHQQDVHREPDQLGREGREPLVLPCRPAVLQDEVLAFDIAERAHPLQERLPIWGASWSWGSISKHTDPVHVRWLLRLRCDRRREDDESERCDEPDGIEPHGALLLSTLGPQKPQE
jgi:hypothetical protein